MYFQQGQASQCLGGEVIMKKMPVWYIHNVVPVVVQMAPVTLTHHYIKVRQKSWGSGWDSQMPLQLICLLRSDDISFFLKDEKQGFRWGEVLITLIITAERCFLCLPRQGLNLVTLHMKIIIFSLVLWKSSSLG